MYVVLEVDLEEDGGGKLPCDRAGWRRLFWQGVQRATQVYRTGLCGSSIIYLFLYEALL